ncbi:unnamed protein product [Caenorhabditis auriculariae]|uniref:PDZ domain-containing protein n=1 Tax=Caenorhabditis auriculariae TaxID=2777116 RepID=A0A8S1GW83_9PELO|nr:unnamed protein product [Caenorhabditis auriculariae]
MVNVDAPELKSVIPQEKPPSNVKRLNINPEELVPPHMIKTLTFPIDCAALQPRLRDFKMTEKGLLILVPSYMTPPLEYADRLISINRTKIKTPQELMDFLTEANKSTKPHTLLFKVRRIMGIEEYTNKNDLPSNCALKRDGPKREEDGYEYYKMTVVKYPKSKLGLNVKSFKEVVYVDMMDNNWESTMRRHLFVGDAILKIGDREVRDVKTCEGLLIEKLSQNGVTTLLIERAVSPNAVLFVRSVLTFNKVEDPQLPSDVIKICLKEMEHLISTGFGPEPKPIYKDPVEKTPSAKSPRVTFSKNFNKYVIGNDQYNPATMMKVPSLTIPSNVEKAMGRQPQQHSS